MTLTHSPPTPTVVAPKAWLGAGLALTAAGWGTNQFPPLIVLYQARLGLSPPALDVMFGLYALGLVPGLLAGDRLSDRFGRRPVVLPAMVISFVATCLLMIGGSHPQLLYVGRLLVGVACGLVFSTGVAWLKELSARSGDGTAGPLRSTVSMSIGFAAGPFVAGCCAQWLPSPMATAYLPHLLVVLVAIAAVWRTPDPGAATQTPRLIQANPPTHPGKNADPRLTVRALIMLVLLPFAPWVYGTASVALAYLPSLVVAQVSGHALLFSAFATALTAVGSLAAQPLARLIHRPHTARLLLATMGLVLIGIGCAALAASTASPVVVLLASVMLGMACGAGLFCGFVEVQQIADPRSLGTVTAVYQVLSYFGFAVPFLLSLGQLHWHIAPAGLLLILLAVAAAASGWLALITTRTHRNPAAMWLY